MTESERYAKELIDEIILDLFNDDIELANNEILRISIKPIAKSLAKIAVRRIIAANPQYVGNIITPPRSVFFEQVLTAIDKN